MRQSGVHSRTMATNNASLQEIRKRKINYKMLHLSLSPYISTV